MRSPTESRDPGRIRLLLTILVLAVVVIAFAIGRATAPEGELDVEHRTPNESAPPTATADEPGAVDAATRFAQIMTGPSADPATYIEEMKSIAASQWKTRSEELAQNGIEFVTERYGEGGSVEFQPVRYRVRSHSPESAVIDIWGVVLGSGPKINGIEESWVTGTVSLVWENSQWKVSGQSSKGGPTPELLRTEEEGTVQEVLADFKEYSDAPGS